MGPSENPPNPPPNQERTGCQRRRCLTRRPRTRRCLLKGCEKRYCPRQAWQRYCGPECREAARAWSRWKAQQRYRATAAGQKKRRAQCRHYRERVRSRKAQAWEAAPAAARVITVKFFSRPAATGRAATTDSPPPGDRHCNASVRRSVGGLWSASGSGNGAGEPRGQDSEAHMTLGSPPEIVAGAAGRPGAAR